MIHKEKEKGGGTPSRLECRIFDDNVYLKFTLVVTFGLFCLLFLVASVYILAIEENDVPLLVPASTRMIVSTKSAPLIDRSRSKRNVHYYSPYEMPLQTWYDMHEENCDEPWQDIYDMDRFKRDAYDIAYYDDDDEAYQMYGTGDLDVELIAREKRHADMEAEIRHWDKEYVRCKKSAPDNPDCERFRSNMRSKIEQLEMDLQEMRNYLRNNDMTPMNRNQDYAEPSNDLGAPHYRNGVDMNADDGLGMYNYPGPVHEDMISQPGPNKHVHFEHSLNIESMLRQKGQPSDFHFEHNPQYEAHGFSDDGGDKGLKPAGPTGVQSRAGTICFHATPVQQYQAVSPYLIPQSPLIPNNNLLVNHHNQQSVFLVPTANSFQNVPQQFGTTSPSGQGFLSHTRAFGDQIEAADTSNTTMSLRNVDIEKIHKDHIAQINKVAPRASRCGWDQFACRLTEQCIPMTKVCDSKVHCLDSSDETQCTCVSRLEKKKLCDGYFDCPDVSDEVGCHNCAPTEMSCYRTKDEFLENNQLRMCFSKQQRCDGIPNCSNGKDEDDCSRILTRMDTIHIPQTHGLLHRNYKGDWYPVCRNGLHWARQACEAEIGTLISDPVLELNLITIGGPFVNAKSENTDDLSIVPSCDIDGQHAGLSVVCPMAKCGSNYRVSQHLELRVRSHASEGMDERRGRQSVGDDAVLGIVGGSQCMPEEWPYIVAIYKDGNFHCGGVIHDNFWIITAAHCFTQATHHYYEVRAGMLRRRSFSPMTQLSIVTNVIVHSGFKLSHMKNDIALIKLRTPLIFNRWVRPICLPTPDRITSPNDMNWANGPPAGTVCRVVGWGALGEQLDGPDNLHEVSVPIMTACKEKDDRQGNEICAGIESGGYDACQGDSGGPLFCHSASNQKEVYLAGIVSHGKGCARDGEPGVYTRVAIFLDWIEQMENSILSLTSVIPKEKCPGFRCLFDDGICRSPKSRCDTVVDCMGGEDEIECRYDGENEVVGAEQAESVVPQPAEDAVKSDAEKEKEKEKKKEKAKEEHNGHATTTLTPAVHVTTPMPQTTPEPSVETSTTSTTTTTTTTSTTTTTTTEKPEVTTPVPTIMTTQVPQIFTTPPSHVKPTPEPSQIIVPVEGEEKHHNHLIPAENETQDGIDSILDGFDTFICTNLTEKISIEHRCDGQIDCADGTDELHCTCRDKLQRNDESKVCDGIVDCDDLTDEQNCLSCNDGEYECRLSKQCIPSDQRCNGNHDCELKEDELDCFALTNGTIIITDINARPDLKEEGIVCQNTKGIWKVLCRNDTSDDKEQLAGKVCNVLGFSGYSESNWHNVEGHHKKHTPLANVDVSTFNKHNRDSQHGFRFRREPETSAQLDDEERHGHRRNHTAHGHAHAHAHAHGHANKHPHAHGHGHRHKHHKTEIIKHKVTCEGLHVVCTPHASSNTPVHKPPHKQPHKPKPSHLKPVKPSIIHNSIPVVVVHANATITVHNETDTVTTSENWPWITSIYVNGDFQCLGVLLDRHWVLADETCINKTRLLFNYVAVSLGHSHTTLNLKAPFEQISRIDCLQELYTYKSVLLHLETPVEYSRYVLPTYLPSSHVEKYQTIDCIAVSRNKHGRLQRVHLKKSDMNCFHGRVCLTKSDEHEALTCELDGNGQFGLVVCRAHNVTSFYPKAFYWNRNGPCTFQSDDSLQSLDGSYSDALFIMEKSYCSSKSAIPHCTSHRCPLGKCLTEKQLCDGRVDCHDSSDEQIEICGQYKKCAVNEMKCRNNKCIPRSKFCDRVQDCGDGSDEPAQCTCLTYLNATEPAKICDGIPNCSDKSDENVQLCPCRPNAFKCTLSGLRCIPNDFVCDQQKDCPHNEDEQYCFGLQQPIVHHDNYALIIEQSFGVWHTKCFSRNIPLNHTQMVDICHRLGYATASNVKWRELNEVWGAREAKYEQPASKIVTTKYRSLKIHDGLTLRYIRPSRPVAHLQPWDHYDADRCIQIEINCFGT